MPRAISDQMISSTMMNGATRSLARTARAAVDPATTAASQAQVGMLRSALPKLDLGEAPGDLTRLGSVRRDPDVGRSLADLAEDGVVHCVPAGGALERGGVQIRDAPEVVLATGQLGSRGSH